jgi:hypothetical protein
VWSFIHHGETLSPLSLVLQVYIQAVLQKLRELPWWQRRGGADHVWVFSADHGFCGFTNGGAGPPALQRSIILTHWGLDHAESPSSTHACFHPDKDLVVPPDALLPHAASTAHHRLPGRSTHTASGTWWHILAVPRGVHG